MSVNKTITVVSTSKDSFEEATRLGVAKASKTLRGVSGAKVIEMAADVANGELTEFRVTLEIAFALEGA